jgi:hypothetical protein
LHHRPVNRCCLDRVHLIKHASNTSVGFQLCQPQNAVNFLSHGKLSSKEKRDGTQLKTHA